MKFIQNLKIATSSLQTAKSIKIIALAAIISTSLTSPVEAFSANKFGNRLIDAVDAGNQDAVLMLLSAGASPNDRGEFEISALHRAAYNGDADMLSLLLSRGGDVNAKDFGGATPLHIAARRNALGVTSILSTANADLNAQDREGYTPLLRSISSENSQLALMLLNMRANPNIANNDGVSPLMEAVRRGVADVVKVAIEKGASLSQKDLNGKDVYDYALNSGNSEIQRILSQANTLRSSDVSAIPTASPQSLNNSFSANTSSTTPDISNINSPASLARNSNSPAIVDNTVSGMPWLNNSGINNSGFANNTTQATVTEVAQNNKTIDIAPPIPVADVASSDIEELSLDSSVVKDDLISVEVKPLSGGNILISSQNNNVAPSTSAMPEFKTTESSKELEFTDLAELARSANTQSPKLQAQSEQIISDNISNQTENAEKSNVPASLRKDYTKRSASVSSVIEPEIATAAPKQIAPSSIANDKVFENAKISNTNTTSVPSKIVAEPSFSSGQITTTPVKALTKITTKNLDVKENESMIPANDVADISAVTTSYQEPYIAQNIASTASEIIDDKNSDMPASMARKMEKSIPTANQPDDNAIDEFESLFDDAEPAQPIQKTTNTNYQVSVKPVAHRPEIKSNNVAPQSNFSQPKFSPVVNTNSYAHNDDLVDAETKEVAEKGSEADIRNNLYNNQLRPIVSMLDPNLGDNPNFNMQNLTSSVDTFYNDKPAIANTGVANTVAANTGRSYSANAARYIPTSRTTVASPEIAANEITTEDKDLAELFPETFALEGDSSKNVNAGSYVGYSRQSSYVDSYSAPNNANGPRSLAGRTPIVIPDPIKPKVKAVAPVINKEFSAPKSDIVPAPKAAVTDVVSEEIAPIDVKEEVKPETPKVEEPKKEEPKQTEVKEEKDILLPENSELPAADVSSEPEVKNEETFKVAPPSGEELQVFDDKPVAAPVAAVAEETMATPEVPTPAPSQDDNTTTKNTDDSATETKTMESPKISEPDLSTPDLAAPELGMPELTTPDPVTPDLNVPEVPELSDPTTETAPAEKKTENKVEGDAANKVNAEGFTVATPKDPALPELSGLPIPKLTDVATATSDSIKSFTDFNSANVAGDKSLAKSHAIVGDFATSDEANAYFTNISQKLGRVYNYKIVSDKSSNRYSVAIGSFDDEAEAQNACTLYSSDNTKCTVKTAADTNYNIQSNLKIYTIVGEFDSAEKAKEFFTENSTKNNTKIDYQVAKVGDSNIYLLQLGPIASGPDAKKVCNFFSIGNKYCKITVN